jgi:hypothetical protein
MDAVTDRETLPALHPDRIRVALSRLKKCVAEESPLYRDHIAAYESGIAALELVRKGQLALGLSAETVSRITSARDSLSGVLGVFEELRRLNR